MEAFEDRDQSPPRAASHWRTARRESGDPQVEEMVAIYLAELRHVMPDFDASRASPPSAEDFSWPNGSFVVVFDGEEPVACGGVRRLSDRTGELRRMWVKPGWRGRGLGRYLLEALEQLGRELELSELCLDTNRALEAALALYRSLGYREVPPYNDNRFADCWMAKTLDRL